tara:strand:- start:74 stop:679 length:606 start_codon:yes stop_codon:yes gene_type:complete
MRHLETLVPEHAVPLICGKGCAMAWRRLFVPAPRDKADGAGKALPYTEKIWFPYHIYTFEMNSRKGPGQLEASVESWSGAFAIFQLSEHLLEGEPESGERFEPRLSIEECEPLARDNLIHTIMRQRSRLGGKPVPGDIVGRETILYPLWIYYFARKRDIIDIKVVDGVTGRPNGHRTRAGVLDAFLAKRGGGDGPEIEDRE